MTTPSATASYGFADKPAGRNAFARAAAAIGGFFADLRRASDAAVLYQRLSQLSDASLAKRGLTREELPRHCYDTAFSK